METDKTYERTAAGNLGFLQEYHQPSGNLADTMPLFRHGKKSNDGISEELKVSNGKISFSVILDKEGRTFSYDVWREDNKDIPRLDPMPIDLKEHTTPSADGTTAEKKYPWWNTRKVSGEENLLPGQKKRETQWIQREEFYERFIQDNPRSGAEHPLKQTTFWQAQSDDDDPLSVDTETFAWVRKGSIGAQVFADLHLNFYEREVWESIIEPLKKSPMKSFWIEEYYTATCWSVDEDEEGQGVPLETIDKGALKRNRLFNKDDSYFLMGDIRQVAKRILEDED